MGDFKRILVPVELTETSLSALRLACDMARVYDAELVLLHVFSMPVVSSAEGFGPSTGADLYGALASEAKYKLAQLVTEATQLGARQVSSHAVEGSAFEQIVAQSEGCDLVVMATHGRRGLSHMLLGSVTEQVIRRAHCPVLTVRPTWG